MKVVEALNICAQKPYGTSEFSSFFDIHERILELQSVFRQIFVQSYRIIVFTLIGISTNIVRCTYILRSNRTSQSAKCKRSANMPKSVCLQYVIPIRWNYFFGSGTPFGGKCSIREVTRRSSVFPEK